MERRLIPSRRGHFAYESGDHGDLWLDLDALVSRPGTLQPYARELAELLRPDRPDVVCGPLTGGAYVAQLAALHLGTAFTWTERRAGRYELAAVPVRGLRVALVDDAVNAASAVTASAAALAAAGAHVVAVAALVTLGSAPPTVAGVPVRSLATLPAARWPAAGCPRCATGSPLDDPSS